MAIYTLDLIGKKQSVVDELLLLNPYQIPLISMVGFSEPIYNTTHEWYEDEMFDTDSIVTAAALVSDTSIVVADTEPFRINQVVKVNEELILITAVNTGTKTLTVTRGYAGTTAAAIAQNDVIEVLFTEGTEGADAREARYKGRKPASNYTQIFDDTIEISGSSEEIAQYGIDDLYEAEKQKKQLELALQLEKAAINGIKYSNGTKRMMGGIRQFIQSNVTDNGGAVLNSLDPINDLAQDIYRAGGFKDGGTFAIMVGAKQKRALSKLDQDVIRIERADNARGQVVTTLITDFGEFEVKLNDNLKSDELILTDINRIKVSPLGKRSFFHTFMGKTGDKTTGQVVGEYTLEFKQEKAHGRIKNIG